MPVYNQWGLAMLRDSSKHPHVYFVCFTHYLFCLLGMLVIVRVSAVIDIAERHNSLGLTIAYYRVTRRVPLVLGLCGDGGLCSRAVPQSDRLSLLTVLPRCSAEGSSLTAHGAGAVGVGTRCAACDPARQLSRGCAPRPGCPAALSRHYHHWRGW